jgi:tetratricopeptide (TPR) repeat protein
VSKRAARFAAVVTALVFAARPAAADTIGFGTLIALQHWIDAVQTHSPGRPDEAVASVAGLSYSRRVELNAGMALFLSFVTERPSSTHGALERGIAELGIAIRQNPGSATFLERAAVLHSDAVIFASLFPSSSDTGAPLDFGRPTARRTGKVPPLLASARVVLDRDGQMVGDGVANWNWPFARSLLDLLAPPTTSVHAGSIDPFISAWYHATAAYMLAKGLYSEATEHLRRAGDLFPDDTRILFDRACYAEILGLPMNQVVRQVWKSGTSNPPIPRAEATNAEAEGLFRRALKADPTFLESRVRLARLLDLRGAHTEAAAELRTALAADPTGAVGFYAQLFAGRVALALGDHDAAARHYGEAASLFPDAQSAKLGQSLASLLGSDVAGALAPVRQLSPTSNLFAADPWWQYQLGAGRDVRALLNDLWARTPK